MPTRKSITTRKPIIKPFIIAVFILAGLACAATAHPLGNFTINHFARLEAGADRVAIHYVIDIAEIPAFQELQKIDTDGDSSASTAELKAYAAQMTAALVEGLRLNVDDAPLLLIVNSSEATMPAGTGGLATLRLECEFTASLQAIGAGTHRIHFEDTNFRDRIGWREVVVNQSAGVSVFDSTAYGNGITDALKAYPEDLLAAPLNERTAEFSLIHGAMPTGATGLLTRDGRVITPTRDRFTELIAVRELTPMIALVGLLIAAGLGAVHALSPGHGKTVVGAYLVGSRGTARHAMFLGLTVTITHTAGVFALGLVTLFASQYVLPEQLFPILTLISGAIVLTVGLSLFVRRLRAARAATPPVHSHHDHDHAHASHAHASHAPSHHANDHVHAHASHAPSHHDHADQHNHDHPHAHDHGDHHHDHHTHDHADHHHDHHHDHDHAEHLHDREGALVHSHGGSTHSHLPPGSDGAAITWRSLLALGISGGLLPCPSALVVMLSAISLHRVGYGLLLVIAFSIGLASTLTCIGLLFVYAKRLLKRPVFSGRLVRLLPVASALVIACAGAVICYEAIVGLR